MAILRPKVGGGAWGENPARVRNGARKKEEYGNEEKTRDMLRKKTHKVGRVLRGGHGRGHRRVVMQRENKRLVSKRGRVVTFIHDRL